MARGRYEAGMTGGREVLESQRVFIAARQNTIELRRAEQDAAATLYKVLGGGTDVDTAGAAQAGGAPSGATATLAAAGAATHPTTAP